MPTVLEILQNAAWQVMHRESLSKNNIFRSGSIFGPKMGGG